MPQQLHPPMRQAVLDILGQTGRIGITFPELVAALNRYYGSQVVPMSVHSAVSRLRADAKIERVIVDGHGKLYRLCEQPPEPMLAYPPYVSTPLPPERRSRIARTAPQRLGRRARI